MSLCERQLRMVERNVRSLCLGFHAFFKSYQVTKFKESMHLFHSIWNYTKRECEDGRDSQLPGRCEQSILTYARDHSLGRLQTKLAHQATCNPWINRLTITEPVLRDHMCREANVATASADRNPQKVFPPFNSRMWTNCSFSFYIRVRCHFLSHFIPRVRANKCSWQRNYR